MSGSSPMVQHAVVQHAMEQHAIVQHQMVQHTKVQHAAVPHTMVQFKMMQYIIHYCTDVISRAGQTKTFAQPPTPSNFGPPRSGVRLKIFQWLFSGRGQPHIEVNCRHTANFYFIYCSPKSKYSGLSKPIFLVRRSHPNLRPQNMGPPNLGVWPKF